MFLIGLKFANIWNWLLDSMSKIQSKNYDALFSSFASNDVKIEMRLSTPMR